MRSHFDRRVISEEALQFLRLCQEHVACHLGGGAALSGAWLAHRLSGDLDLFCHAAEDVRLLVRALPAIARAVGAQAKLLRDSGTHVRAEVTWGPQRLEVDFVHEALPDLEPPPPPLEGVVVESALDLRAAKLTCILSRSEPRDLVDLLFLERAGFAVEADLPFALQKDAGIDPAILGWLLRTFPVEPLPNMLLPLSVAELRSFRDDLAERLRLLSLPP